VGDFDWQFVLMRLFALLIAIPVHEFAHALSAVNNGDDGPRRDGRLSILPQDHFDPFGALFCVVSTISGFGLGWGRPVLVNPRVLHNPKWDMCKIAAWGPFSNLLLAIAFSLPIRFGWAGDEQLLELLWVCMQVNLGLLLFNLIPIGPLDGAKILATFLPDAAAYEFSKFMERYGMILLLGLITIGQSALYLCVSVPRAMISQVLLSGRI
jgi:Zn-dependent protease